MSTQVIIISFALFLLGGLLEIDGGYLVWQWLREGAALWIGLAGAVALMLW